MERLTWRNNLGVAMWKMGENGGYRPPDKSEHEKIDRLAAYEDAEEDGTIVNVVHCKDCIYAPTGTDDGEEQGFGLEWPDRETYKCPFQCDDGWYSKKPKPDFFCANGERKQD